jgi:type I restriction enzyme, S subunit
MSNYPHDWQVETLGELVKKNRPIGYGVVQTGPSVTDGVPCVRVVDLTNGNLSPENMITTSQEISHAYKRTILQSDDLMMALRGEIGFVVKVPPQLVGANLTRGVALISPDHERVAADYLVQALKSDFVREEIMSQVNGSALQEIPIGGLKKVHVPLPPLPEQRAIAAILSTWDEAITLTEALIEALQHRKQALMQSLLTGEVRFQEFVKTGDYKQTELGVIPEDWSVTSIDNISSQVTNGFVGTASPFHTDDTSQVIYLQGYNVRQNKIDLYNVTYVTEEFSQKQAKSILRLGDILTVQSGHIGTTAVVPPELYGANCHALIITRLLLDKADPNFVAYYLNSVLSTRLKALHVGSSILHINTSELKEFLIPSPSLDEQSVIADILSVCDEAITYTEGLVEALQTQKRALMQQLLTGAIRVQTGLENE